MSNLRKKLIFPVLRFMQRHGITVARYPLQDCLRHVLPTTVLDVGANVGQYGQELRSLGYRGKIQSFEPFPPAFDVLQQLAATSTPANAWQTHNFGLGEKVGEAAMNVSLDSRFNSLREPLLESGQLFPTIISSKKVSVKIRTLSFVWQELKLSGERVFLKMDTQGYELPILKGGLPVLEKFSAIQLEVPLTPLYAGQPCVEEVVPFLRERGFRIFGAWKGEGVRGKHKEIYEMDFIFVRS